MSDKRRKILERITDLSAEFEYFLNQGICKTD